MSSLVYSCWVIRIWNPKYPTSKTRSKTSLFYFVSIILIKLGQKYNSTSIQRKLNRYKIQSLSLVPRQLFNHYCLSLFNCFNSSCVRNIIIELKSAIKEHNTNSYSDKTHCKLEKARKTRNQYLITINIPSYCALAPLYHFDEIIFVDRNDL